MERIVHALLQWVGPRPTTQGQRRLSEDWRLTTDDSAVRYEAL
jgi:hypothetical protein